MKSRYEIIEDTPKARYEFIDDSTDPINQENPANPSFMDKAANYAGKFNNAIEASRLPDVAGGLLQGVGDIGASIANVPLAIIGKYLKKDIRQPHPDLQPSDDSLLSKAAFGGGELLGGIPGLGMAANAIGKIGGATKTVSQLPFIGKLIARPLEGVAAGTVIGENAQGDRTGGAIEGGIGNVPISLNRLINRASSKGVAESILNAKKSAQNKYENLYNELFDKAEKSGHGESETRIPKLNSKFIKKYSSSDYHQSLLDYIKNPTLRNAHIAQSDMGKLKRYLENISLNKDLGSKKLKLMSEVEKAQKKLRGTIFQSLTKSGDRKLGDQYQRLTNEYKTEVVPYLRNKAINQYQRNEIYPEEFAKKIAKSSKFNIAIGDRKHPEIKEYKQLGKWLNKIPRKYLIGAAAGAEGLNLYKGDQ
jgi:hypothetical protein